MGVSQAAGGSQTGSEPDGTAVSGTSHSQQSLQRAHRVHRWFSHASLVQYTQIAVEDSPQMLQAKVRVSVTANSVSLPPVALAWPEAPAGAKGRRGSAAPRDP